MTTSPLMNLKNTHLMSIFIYMNPHKADQNNQNDHSDQDDEILNDHQFEHLDHNNDNHIIDNLPNTKDVQTFEPLSFPTEDALVSNTISVPTNPFLSILSMASLAPLDRLSQDKHIELVNIIGNPRVGMLTRAMAKELSAASAHECLFVDFLSEEEPEKTRLVTQGYNQQEGIEYDETFTPVARLEAIRIILAFGTYMNFIVYQMDVKSVFLNGKLKEEVYVKQPPSFESSEFPNHVCKLDKALYGLNQAPRAWYMKDTPSVGLWYPKCLGFDLKGYSDSDYARRNIGFATVLAILVTGASQSRQHESCKSPTAELFDVDSGKISIVNVNTKEYHSNVLARSQG
ncbi:retrovirus-related pol polyprotein from transposon TNT 1-94 [Tanacetum coccineum]